MCCLHQTSIIHISTYNDTGRIKIIVQSLALTQKLRAENDVVAVEFLTNTCSVTNRNRTLDNHNGFRIVLNDQLDDGFYRTGVKEILLAIVICRSSDHYKISVTIRFLSIQSCCQIQLFFRQILFDIFILNRRFLVVNQFHFLRNNVHSSHFMMLRQQRRNGKAHITRTSHSNLQILKFSHDIYLLYL